MIRTQSKTNELVLSNSLDQHNALSIHSFSERINAFLHSNMQRKLEMKDSGYVNRLSAVLSDPNREILPEMTEVSDIGFELQTPAELSEARAYFDRLGHVPPVWRHYYKTGKYPPFLFSHTSFITLFSKDTVILYDMYRPPWKPYFTSDVFFYQWLKSLGREIDLMNLLVRFPEKLFIHNITNQLTRRILQALLDEVTSDFYLIDEVKNVGVDLTRSPHMKNIFHILNTYNRINRLRNLPAAEIISLQIYRQNEAYHLKFRIGSAG